VQVIRQQNRSRHVERAQSSCLRYRVAQEPAGHRRAKKRPSILSDDREEGGPAGRKEPAIIRHADDRTALVRVN
jgi:hypothetical protein